MDTWRGGCAPHLRDGGEVAEGLEVDAHGRCGGAGGREAAGGAGSREPRGVQREAEATRSSRGSTRESMLPMKSIRRRGCTGAALATQAMAARVSLGVACRHGGTNGRRRIGGGVEAEWNQQAAALDLAIAGQREAGGNGGGDRCSERERRERGSRARCVSRLVRTC